MRKSEFKAGDFLSKEGELGFGFIDNPTAERVFITDGTVDGDGYGVMLGYSGGRLLTSTGYGNYCYGGPVRLATEDEIKEFATKLHDISKIGQY